MPKIKPPPSNPFSIIEAPSTAALNGRKFTEELFHLERTIANSESSSRDVADSMSDLKDGIDCLSRAVEELTLVAEKIEDLLTKIVEKETDA